MPSVLLVDSDREYRNHTAEILSSRGFSVAQAGTAEEARATTATGLIDFAALAIPFAEPTSIALAKELVEAQPNMRIAFLTDQRPAPLPEPFEQLEIRLVLRKPTLPEELAHRISRLLALEGKQPDGAEDANQFDSLDSPDFLPDLNERTKTEIDKIRSAYALKIPEIFSNMGQLLVDAQSESETSTAMKEARRLAHSMAGTSGTLGFKLVAPLAASMDKVLEELLEIRKITSIPPLDLKDRDSRMSEISQELQLTGERSAIINVLVVDDDRDFLKSVVAMGHENLIRVHAAQNGEDALELAMKQRLDAAIIDVYLSDDENPFLIAQRVRSLDGLEDLPIAFISADTSIPTRIAAAHAGASQFLDKPLTINDFTAAVRRLAPLDTADRARIFVVDDDGPFLRTMSTILNAEGMKVDTLADPTKILDVIGKIRPDLLLLDVVMPEISGIDVCRILRSSEKWRDLPILFMTVQTNPEILLQCFEAGGDDYIEKPVLREELLARINVRLERVRFFRERADRDGLTGLLTRRAYVERFKIQLSEATRYKKPVSLCLIDLDHFKEVNDRYGHLAGDRVLSKFGRLLSSRFRAMDVRCRWGGEEFAVSFYNEEAETAGLILDRVHEEFRQMRFTGDHGEKFHVTFSAGITTFPKDGDSLEDLFGAADKKLYQAKQQGRDRISC